MLLGVYGGLNASRVYGGINARKCMMAAMLFKNIYTYFSKVYVPKVYFSKVYVPKVYFSKAHVPKVYFYEVYQTCVSSKRGEFLLFYVCICMACFAN